jgi:Kdo2-lipid IVA lauroyltransferase/acyltransferase
VRSAPGLEAAPVNTSGVRLLLKALKKGRVIGLLPDQVPASGLGVWAPFFGQDAYTMTLAVRLAQQTGATMLMTWGERLPRGRGYVVHIEPLQLPLDQPHEVAAAALNQRLEALIRRRPDLYLWGYARYKQPKVEPKTESAGAAT